MVESDCEPSYPRRVEEGMASPRNRAPVLEVRCIPNAKYRGVMTALLAGLSLIVPNSLDRPRAWKEESLPRCMTPRRYFPCFPSTKPALAPAARD
jgi:hypothetical protein